MAGGRLEVDTHIVTGGSSFITNVLKCVQRAGLETLGRRLRAAGELGCDAVAGREAGRRRAARHRRRNDRHRGLLARQRHLHGDDSGRRKHPDERHLARPEDDARGGRGGEEAPRRHRSAKSVSTSARSTGGRRESIRRRSCARSSFRACSRRCAWPSRRSSRTCRAISCWAKSSSPAAARSFRGSNDRRRRLRLAGAHRNAQYDRRTDRCDGGARSTRRRSVWCSSARTATATTCCAAAGAQTRSSTRVQRWLADLWN